MVKLHSEWESNIPPGPIVPAWTSGSIAGWNFGSPNSQPGFVYCPYIPLITTPLFRRPEWESNIPKSIESQFPMKKGINKRYYKKIVFDHRPWYKKLISKIFK